MKLLYGPGSPFARKVTATIVELGLEDRVEKVPVNHRASDGGLWEYNPFAKVPTLIRDDGKVTLESLMICEYLDSMVGGRLYPSEPAARYRVQQLIAFGENILEASMRFFQEIRRPENLVWQEEAERYKAKIPRAVAILEADPDRFGGPVNLGHISLGVALAYCDKRVTNLDWRSGAPRLAAWFKEFETRPAMVKSAPPPG